MSTNIFYGITISLEKFLDIKFTPQIQFQIKLLYLEYLSKLLHINHDSYSPEYQWESTKLWIIKTRPTKIIRRIKKMYISQLATLFPDYILFLYGDEIFMGKRLLTHLENDTKLYECQHVMDTVRWLEKETGRQCCIVVANSKPY